MNWLQQQQPQAGEADADASDAALAIEESEVVMHE